MLIYDGASEPRKLVGYADANLFAKELLLYKSAERSTEIERILRQTDLTLGEFARYFATFRTEVVNKDVANAYEAAEEMLTSGFNEILLVSKREVYLVELSKIVKIAS